jgi:hypothetical protein
MKSVPLLSLAVGSLVLLSTGTMAEGHPGVGIVRDSRGNVFFTDLRQVWKITPDDKLSVAVPDVHAHELCLDAEDNLFGEHLWGEGGGWRHRVWCLRPTGSLSDVVSSREGFLRGYGFVRDRAGNMYWADRGTKMAIKKRSPEGTVTTHAIADFRALQWMTATADGVLFLMDGGDLRRVSPDGHVTTVVTSLSEHEPPPAGASDRNYHMGLWTDKEGFVYVAVARERLVLRVQADGKKKVIARTGDSWSPSGGMFDRDDNLWLLEYNSANAVRAVRTDREGRERVFSPDLPRRSVPALNRTRPVQPGQPLSQSVSNMK